MVETIESKYMISQNTTDALLLSEDQINCCDYGRGDLGKYVINYLRM